VVSETGRAKEAINRGIATIAPLAMGKEESLKEAQKGLDGIANRLAGLVGDAPPAAEAGEPGKDDEEQQEPLPTPTPAPSPNPLPPPPPPPPQVPAGAK